MMEGDFVPVNVPESALRDEVNSRTFKAGYTGRDGEQWIRGIRSMPATEAYRRGWDRVWGKKKR